MLLMPHPADVVLLPLQSGKGVLFEALDDLLARLGRDALVLFLREGQHAVRVAVDSLQRVDQVSRDLRIAAQDLGPSLPIAQLGEVVRYGTTRGAGLTLPNALEQHRSAFFRSSAVSQERAPQRLKIVRQLAQCQKHLLGLGRGLPPQLPPRKLDEKAAELRQVPHSLARFRSQRPRTRRAPLPRPGLDRDHAPDILALGQLGPARQLLDRAQFLG